MNAPLPPFFQATSPASGPPRSNFLRAPRPGLRAGFSLVEVVMAVGIVAAVFVPLLGMLPVALSGYRQAMDATLRANMARQVASQFQQAPFDQVASHDFYFDDQGVLLTGAMASARFRVVCTTSSADTNLFGGTPANPALKRVQMQMRSLLGTADGVTSSTITALIADNGLRSSTTASTNSAR